MNRLNFMFITNYLRTISFCIVTLIFLIGFFIKTHPHTFDVHVPTGEEFQMEYNDNEVEFPDAANNEEYQKHRQEEKEKREKVDEWTQMQRERVEAMKRDQEKHPEKWRNGKKIINDDIANPWDL